MQVLSIDGGGIRGIIPALVLTEIERRCDARCADLFDLIAGTSTGAIIACALTRPDSKGQPMFKAEDVVGLYLEHGPEIFHRSFTRRILTIDGMLADKFSDRALNRVLDQYLGDARLSDALTNILLTSYEIKRRHAFFFRSGCAREDLSFDFPMAKAARAATAAPTYFAPATVRDALDAQTYDLVDGGVFAVNPALVALTDITVRGERDRLKTMVSLGTGSLTRPIDINRARHWGKLQWARPIVDVVFDSIADTTEFELRTLLSEHYSRFQIDLHHASDDLDDASDRNIKNLVGEAQRLIRDRSAAIDTVCAQLIQTKSNQQPLQTLPL